MGRSVTVIVVELVITSRIIIVERGGPRQTTLAAGISHFLHKVFVKRKEKQYVAD